MNERTRKLLEKSQKALRHLAMLARKGAIKTISIARSSAQKAGPWLSKNYRGLSVWLEEKQIQAQERAANRAADRERTRLHKQQAEQERKERAEREEKERLEAEIQRLKNERFQRHNLLIETLSDDLNSLEHNVGNTFKLMPPEDRNRLLSMGSGLDIGGHGLNILNNQREVQKALEKGVPFYVCRTVVDMNEKEIGALKLLSYLNSKGIVSDRYYDYSQLCIAYNRGDSMFKSFAKETITRNSDMAISVMMNAWMKQQLEPSKIAVNEMLAHIGWLRKQEGDPEWQSIIDQELRGAQGWMRSDAV